MSENQYEMMLPISESEIAVLGSIHCIMKELGRELGERYIPHFEAALGPNWLVTLQNPRERQINPVDPHFVLLEPLKFHDSPARQGLQLNGIQLNILDAALDERNRWAHNNMPPLTLESLAESIKPFHAVATSLGLGGLGKLCSETKKRIKAIKDGAFKPAPRIQSQSSISDLKSAHSRLQREKEQLEADVRAAMKLAQDAEGAGLAAQQAAAVQLADLQNQFAAALTANEELEFKIQGLAAAQRALEEPWVEVRIGHAWPEALPERELVLMSLHNNLMDPITGQQGADEFGPDAPAVIKQFKALLPGNARIRCNSHGQCVSYLGGQWTYMGCLNGEREPGDEPAFFLPHTYTLRMNGEIEDAESGLLLSDTVGDLVAERVSGEVLAHVPDGASLRITPTGGVAAQAFGHWTELLVVSPDEWFEGHLQ